jgi:glycosyltransferase involved in cell wall biosynthesis
MAHAHGVYIGFVDGDGQIPPESVVACLAKAQAENLDLVKTYRIERDDGLYRKLVSVIYNAFFRLLFGSIVRDVNSKPKIIRRDKYEHLKLQSDDWFIDAEIILRADEMSLRTGEIPIHFSANEHRASFVKPVAILQFITNMLRYPLKRFG